jgi:hypothetical protein
MRIADDTEAIGRRYRELFRPSSEQPSPPKPEPETKSTAETPRSSLSYKSAHTIGTAPNIKANEYLHRDQDPHPTQMPG